MRYSLFVLADENLISSDSICVLVGLKMQTAQNCSFSPLWGEREPLLCLIAFLFFLLLCAPTQAATVETAFSPEQGATDLIVRTIGEAKQSVYVAAYFSPHILSPRLWSMRMHAAWM
jgi:hypothetical protein